MQNIEFKCEIRGIEIARQQCALLDAERIGSIRQTDTYYRLPNGRLKRREAPGEPVEWIYYHRADRSRPKLSNYSILSDEQAKRRWGTESLREWVVVRKTRELWMLDNIRIHLDEVDEVGTFIEFEAQLSRLHDVKSCHQRIAALRREFAPILGEPISVSYSDLVAEEAGSV